MQAYGAIGEDALPDKARRRFLTASALLIGFAFVRPLRAFEREPDLAAIGALDAAATGFDGFVPDGFIRIGVDGRIVLVVPSVEMGQGIATGEAMMIAEELEVGLDQVEVALPALRRSSSPRRWQCPVPSPRWVPRARCGRRHRCG